MKIFLKITSDYQPKFDGKYFSMHFLLKTCTFFTFDLSLLSFHWRTLFFKKLGIGVSPRVSRKFPLLEG